MATQKEYDAAFAAVEQKVIEKIRASKEIPSMFEKVAEGEVPKHARDVRDISNAAVDAAEKARATG